VVYPLVPATVSPVRNPGHGYASNTLPSLLSAWRQRWRRIRRRWALGRDAEFDNYGIGIRTGNDGGKPAGEQYKPVLAGARGGFDSTPEMFAF
jgi:hypothetical protein